MGSPANVSQFDVIAVKEIVFSEHGAAADALVSGALFMSGGKLQLGAGSGNYEEVTSA